MKINPVIIFFGVILCFPSICEAFFSDLSIYHKNFEAITFSKKYNYIQGYPDQTFRPEQDINRAEFTKIIISSQFSEEEIDNCQWPQTNGSGQQIIFHDLPEDAWFTPFICVAYKQKIINGYNDQTFRPEQNINFVQAAKIIVNTQTQDNLPDNIVWYRPYVKYLANHQAIPESITGFNHIMTRGEIAELIYRLLGPANKKHSLTYQQLTESQTKPNSDLTNLEITIDVYFDYSSLYSQKYLDILTKLQKKYPQQIKLEYFVFPNPNNDRSILAAKVAWCAKKQDKFLVFHNWLYKNFQQIALPFIKRQAYSHNLNLFQFQACLEAEETDQTLADQITNILDKGVKATPTLIVNDQIIEGSFDLNSLEKILINLRPVHNHKQMPLHND